MTLSEFNASLPKREAEEQKWHTSQEYVEHLEKQLEICQKENVELRNTIKQLLEYIKQENNNG